MTVEMLAAAPARVATPDRFLVLWQSPTTGAYHRVGTLTRDAAGYRFSYSAAAEALVGFDGFVSFPDFHAEYRSAELFATFANRVMTPQRDSYQAYVRALGITEARPEPFEVLARTLGTRATDLVQLLPVPTVDEGIVSFHFLVHGGRHVDPAGAHLARIHERDELFLAPEDGNPVSPVAVLVGDQPCPTRDRAVGYVPDVFGRLVRWLLDAQAPLRVIAERVNREADGDLPDHLRLLVRLDALLPLGFDVEDALPE